MTTTEQKLRESILTENLKKLVSMLYDRLEDLTIEELENLEYSANLCNSKFLTSISHELEKRK